MPRRDINSNLSHLKLSQWRLQCQDGTLTHEPVNPPSELVEMKIWRGGGQGRPNAIHYVTSRTRTRGAWRLSSAESQLGDRWSFIWKNSFLSDQRISLRLCEHEHSDDDDPNQSVRDIERDVSNLYRCSVPRSEQRHKTRTLTTCQASDHFNRNLMQNKCFASRVSPVRWPGNEWDRTKQSRNIREGEEEEWNEKGRMDLF